jgi:phosphoribosyl 1,2-cyclic phosphodiesterase
MSLKIQVLSSGSCGNAALYSAGKTHILVDCGLSARSLTALLSKAGLEPSDLSGIFITHEHTDHVKGVPVFLKRRTIPLFISPTSLETEPFYGVDIASEPIGADRPVTLGPLTVTPFPVPHDAACCFGFVLEAFGVKAVHATDLGRPTALVEQKLKGAHCMLIEFNHDLDRLMAGPYPMHVKLRVKSDLGHLSNEQAGRLLAGSTNGETQAVYLMHLSKENNLPALARLAAREALGERKIRVEVAKHLVPAPAWEG